MVIQRTPAKNCNEKKNHKANSQNAAYSWQQRSSFFFFKFSFSKIAMELTKIIRLENVSGLKTARHWGFPTSPKLWICNFGQIFLERFTNLTTMNYALVRIDLLTHIRFSEKPQGQPKYHPTIYYTEGGRTQNGQP